MSDVDICVGGSIASSAFSAIQKGCNIGECDCLAPFFVCNPSKGLRVPSVTDPTSFNAPGECDLSLFGMFSCLVVLVLILLTPSMLANRYTSRKAKDLLDAATCQPEKEPPDARDDGDITVVTSTGQIVTEMTASHLSAPATLEEQEDSVIQQEDDGPFTLTKAVQSIVSLVTGLFRTKTGDKSENDIQEMIEKDTDSYSVKYEHFFDTQQIFDRVPNEEFGTEKRVTIFLEVMSKTWLQVVFYTLICSTIVSVVLCIVPFSLQEHVSAVSPEICKHNLTNASASTNGLPVTQCGFSVNSALPGPNVSISLLLEKQLTLGTKYISFGMSLADDVVLVPLDPDGFAQLDLNFVANLLHQKHAISPKPLESKAAVLCECEEVQQGRGSKCSCDQDQEQLVYATLNAFGGVASKPELFAFQLNVSSGSDTNQPAIFKKLPKIMFVELFSTSFVIKNIVLWTLVCLDAVALAWWLYMLRFGCWLRLENPTTAPPTSSVLLPERLLLLGLLAVNLATPVVQVYVLEAHAELWVLAMSTLWFLIVITIIDLQRHRIFSWQLVRWKLLGAILIFSVHSIGWEFLSGSLLIMLDLGLFLVAVASFWYIGVKTSRNLRRSHYFASRSHQLSFRLLMLLTYCLLFVLVFQASHFGKQQVHRFVSRSVFQTSLGFTILSHAGTFIMMIMFAVPPKKYLQATAETPDSRHEASFFLRGFSTKTVNCDVNRVDLLASQMDLKPLSSLSTVSLATKSNNKPEAANAQEESAPFWRAPDRFSFETCCCMYNAAMLVYKKSLDADGDASQVDLVLEREGMKLITSYVESTTDTKFLIMRSRHRLILAFRGTMSKQNAKTDLKIQFCDPEEYQELAVSAPDVDSVAEATSADSRQAASTGRVCVHQGFYEAYNTVRDLILSTMKQTINEMGGKDQVQIYTTGHSLGGALATLATLDLSTKLQTRVVMYNFGSPRVGNHQFAELFNRHVPQAYRVVNDGDLVAGYPKRAKWGMYCVGGLRYKHIGTQVLLANRAFGVIIVNPNVVEIALMARRRSNGVSHMMTSYQLKLALGVACAIADATGEKMSKSLMKERQTAAFFATQTSSQSVPGEVMALSMSDLDRVEDVV